jgi:hypothetical protein
MSLGDFNLPAEAAANLMSLATKVAELRTPEPISLTFTFDDICCLEDDICCLEDAGLTDETQQKIRDKTKCIYVFRLINGATKESLSAAYPKSKEAKKGRAYARFSGGKTDCLYVGSCFTTPTLTRLKQHFGLGPAGTYAMHLKHWTHGISGGIEISVYSYGNDATQEVLQTLEDCLHSRLKPMLGRRGRN